MRTLRIALLALLSVAIGAAQDPPCHVTDMAKLHLAAQKRTGRPVSLFVMRPVFNRGEAPFVEVGRPYRIARTYDTGYDDLGPFPIPFVNVGPFEGFQQHQQAALADIKGRYTSDPRFDRQALSWVASDMQHEMDNPSERMLWYLVLNRINPRPGDPYAAFARVFDGSRLGGKEELQPLERDTGWTVPERATATGDFATIEIGRVLHNPSADLRQLSALPFIFQEIATYADMHYVSRNIPGKVRLLVTDEGRKDVWTDPVRYGFQIERNPQQLKEERMKKNGGVDPAGTSMDHTYVLYMDMKDFVKRYNSRWAQWALALEPGQTIPNLLSDPTGVRSLVARLMSGLQVQWEYHQRTYPYLPGVTQFNPEIPEDFQPYPDFGSFIQTFFRQLPRLLF